MVTIIMVMGCVKLVVKRIYEDDQWGYTEDKKYKELEE